MERTLASTAEKENAVFMVLLDDSFCGVMSLNALDLEKDCADLDYWIAADYQGRGIGTEAVRLTVNHARESFTCRCSSVLVSSPILLPLEYLRRMVFTKSVVF